MKAESRVLAEETDDATPEPGILLVPGWRERFGVIAGIASGPADYALARGTGEWAGLSKRLAPHSFSSTTLSYQIHGTVVRRGQEATPGLHALDGFDGHLTTHPGALLGITVADCVPVYLFAPETGHLGLLHAGWRGAASGILEHALEMLAEEGVSASKVVVHLGVSICGRCYEVGTEVFEALGLEAIADNRPVDLRRALADRALASGVKELSISPWCTKEDTRFHSYRRDGARSGRMAAFIGRPLP